MKKSHLVIRVLPHTLAFLAIAGCGSDSRQMPSEQSINGTAGHQAAELDPILAEPRVGDLYAAELSAFSAVNFNRRSAIGGRLPKAFGLLKVIDVRSDRVIAISEQSAWDNPIGAINDLNGDLSGISWDQDEKIPIKKHDFAKLMRDKKILETRRLS